jgi:hypothetical protein
MRRRNGRPEQNRVFEYTKQNGKPIGASSCFLTYPAREETSSAPALRGSTLPSPAADGEKEERGGGVKTGGWNAKAGARREDNGRG